MRSQKINSWMARLVRGTVRYGPMFAAEVVLFWLILEAVNSSGYATVKALIQQPNRDWVPVAVVTTGPADVGRTLLGVPVIGSANNLRRWIKEAGVQGVAVVEGAVSDRVHARRLFSECLAARVP